jgi:hypothetical protein
MLSLARRLLPDAEYNPMGAEFQPLPDGAVFGTPQGEIHARVREVYKGMHGQLRICLVDKHGRVSHYNTDEIHPKGDPLVVECRKPAFARQEIVHIEIRRAPSVKEKI